MHRCHHFHQMELLWKTNKGIYFNETPIKCSCFDIFALIITAAKHFFFFWVRMKVKSQSRKAKQSWFSSPLCGILCSWVSVSKRSHNYFLHKYLDSCMCWETKTRCKIGLDVPLEYHILHGFVFVYIIAITKQYTVCSVKNINLKLSPFCWHLISWCFMGKIPLNYFWVSF